MPDEVELDSTVIHVGCADLPPGLGRRRYFERLTYLETASTLFQLPEASVLGRWRKDAGEQGRFGLVAPQVITHRPGRKGYQRSPRTFTAEELAQAGGFRDTTLVRQAVEELAQTATAIGAEVVLFRAPPDFAPSAANRDTLRAFFQELAPRERFGDALRVWEPQGLWEVEPAAKLAQELDVVLACDPLTHDPLALPPEAFAHLPCEDIYFRITGLGHPRPRFDGDAMESLSTAVEAYTRAWVVFAHTGKYPDAIRLRQLLDTLDE